MGASDTTDEAQVVDEAAELRGEAAGELLDQRVAVWVAGNHGPCSRVGYVVDDPNDRAVAGQVVGNVGHFDGPSHARAVRDRGTIFVEEILPVIEIALGG